MITRAQIAAGERPAEIHFVGFSTESDQDVREAQRDIDELLYRSYVPGRKNAVFWKITGTYQPYIVQLYTLYASDWLVQAELDTKADDAGFLCFFWEE